MTRERALLGGVLAIGGLASGLALWAALDDSDTELLPPLWRWPVAGVLSLVWLLSAGRAWAVLLESPSADRRQITGALYLSQLTKYVPGGGLLQAGSVVALSTGGDVTLAHAGVALPVSVLLTVLSCLTVGAGAILVTTSLPLWAQLLALVGILAPLGTYRPLSAALLRLAKRVVPRLPDIDHLPRQGAMVKGFALTLVGVLATSASYAVLASAEVDRSFAAITVAFAVAWLAGYLVVPIPGGLGVREAVLVGLLGGPAAPVVAASLAHRIVTITAELLTVSGHLAGRTRGS